METDGWVGQRGFWIDDNEPCHISAVVDSGAGLYEFESLESFGVDDTWIGFIEDFLPEC